MISEHIGFLIRHHDCVIIPGWGALIAQYCPAKIDEENGVMLPPSRVLGFNGAIAHNDAMLAMSVSRRKGISYDGAVSIVAQEVDALRHQLAADGEVAIPKIGIFKQNSDNAVTFNPFPEMESSSEFIGLTAVDVTPIVERRNASRKKDQEYTKRKDDVIYLPVSRSIFKIAASLILLIGLGLVLSTPIVDDKINYASISTPAVTMPEPDEVQLKPTDGLELFVAMPLADDGVAIDERATKEVIKGGNVPNEVCAGENAVRFETEDRYCLVIASLASRELADRYMAELDFESLGLLEMDGKYRVYVATGSTFSQAVALMRDSGFASKYPDAWVCRR